ncbi:MAG: Cna B-type domain-containing protein, partial [Oscillospiraceae bacterium]|nr:Cna B-type domain-containing protein [Oscillospiraceae bacterium]
TRYGQWYGNPYGDWGAMFVSFCLDYAGTGAAPANAGVEPMRLEWEAAQLYIAADLFSPQPGNLLFLHKSEDPEAAALLTSAELAQRPANAVAIITDFDGTNVFVIEGDVDGVVAETSYAINDPAILGYGLVPEDPNFSLMVERPETAHIIASYVKYTPEVVKNGGSFLIYTESNGNYYAFDGTGNAVQVYPDENGNIYTEEADMDNLLWTFTVSNGADTYVIQNQGSGRYMHAYPNNGSGVTTTSKYTSVVIEMTDGINIRSNSEYAKLNVEDRTFVVTKNQSEAALYQIAVSNMCTVWLDGTNGGLGLLTGSKNQSYQIHKGDTITLPENWQTPSKYAGRVKGWYDVVAHKYYAAGEKAVIDQNTVFYADWVAASYDIGVYNAHTANTVSTNAFITTHVFDYNYLFNIHSENATVTVSDTSHSESWTMVTGTNKVHYNDQQTMDFIFVDYDGRGDINLPNDQNDRNSYLGAGIITQGIYSSQLGTLLFDPGVSAPGKHYLGTGDYLFQFMDDPNSEYFGYYYYDAQLNAASYNQSQQRFFVYDYLEATSDSLSSSGKYSDFLPFNSPYANLNDHDVQTYTYAGVNGEYSGINHYRYDAKYSGSNNSEKNTATNYAFGMRMNVSFYLPNDPGSKTENGEYGNRDLYGNQMHFKFSGDDDVWVLIDGTVILDLGGVHGVESGDINFSTGVVTINGKTDNTLTERLAKVTAGDHTLTVMYLERGSSQSNCAFYFNLAPRFSLSIQKEDVLTQEVLNGTGFSVFTDAACTKPAQLWTSESAHASNAPATNTFTVVNGVANMWGLAAGNTYYIKETVPPDANGYSLPSGIIRLTIDKEGIATYDMEIIPQTDANGNELPISTGFTVHGVKIDEETQKAYIIVTNAQDSPNTEPVTVHVRKKWNDSVNHSGQYVTVYLTITDPDGTNRRIREIMLSDENKWQYSWTNLPKYDSQGNENRFGIEEAYQSGYTPVIETVTQYTSTDFSESYSFVNGETYLLKTNSGYLSSTSSTGDTLKWVSESEAITSPLAKWTATVSGNNVKFTNGAGQVLSFNYNTSSSNRYMYVTTGTTSYQSMQCTSTNNGFRIAGVRNNRQYYITGLGNNGFLSVNTSSSGAVYFHPMVYKQKVESMGDDTDCFLITNVPLDEETAVAVTKAWDLTQAGSDVQYLQSQVTVRLLANGVDTGRTITLNLKNNWKGIFQGLPYRNDNDDVIVYTVEEVWTDEFFLPVYGEIQVDDSTDIPTYSISITNVYRAPGGPELPATGTIARMLFFLFGSAILLTTFAYGIFSRRIKRSRRRHPSKRRH